jgi:hypothetical protein
MKTPFRVNPRQSCGARGRQEINTKRKRYESKFLNRLSVFTKERAFCLPIFIEFRIGVYRDNQHALLPNVVTRYSFLSPLPLVRYLEIVLPLRGGPLF